MHDDIFAYLKYYSVTDSLLCYLNLAYQVLILYFIIDSLNWLVNCSVRMHLLCRYNW